jgi:inner membrane protein
METNINTEPAKEKSFFKRNVYGIKAVLIGVLVLLLLIPANMIMGIISERERRQYEATGEVSGKWGDAQTITGPVIVIPYIVKPGETSIALFLPDKLNINGELLPEVRKRGIYQVAVYNSHLQINGAFSALDFAGLNIPKENLLLKDAYLAVGIKDMRGISNQAQVVWQGQTLTFNPGVNNKALPNGMQTRIPLNFVDDSLKGADFSITLDLRGSGQVFFSPVGKSTVVDINSNWTHPSFDGAFLPNKHNIHQKGFTASWQVSHLNRNFPQSWKGDEHDLHTADFGVNLFLPVDGYQQSTRAVKYAILIIGLTFLVFYFIELLQRYSVHPLQYILIGLALCIFYTLLIALAEQLNFTVAYAISALLTLGMVTAYTASVFRNYRTAAGIGGILTILYGFIYVIIRSEDQALLMGSLGLFIILAVVMYFSRKIKWNEL